MLYQLSHVRMLASGAFEELSHLVVPAGRRESTLGDVSQAMQIDVGVSP